MAETVVKERRTAEDVIVSRSPATGEVLGEAKVFSPDEVRAAVERARKAQGSWAAVPLRERIRIMENVQDRMANRADELAGLLSAEVGKARFEALGGDVLLSLYHLQYLIDNAPRILKPQKVRHWLPLFWKQSGHVEYFPLGVVAVIAPYNFPALLTLHAAFAALMAGNAVVNKPSELASMTALRIAEIFATAGLPADVFQVVTGYGPTGAALVEAGVDKVVFTGSTATGRKIAAAAAERLIPVTMELGGKDAFIVLEDADLDRAAECAAFMGNVNCGQVCGAAERIYVVEEVADAFVERLVHRVGDLRLGPDVTDSGAVDVGPLATEKQLAKVHDQVQTAVQDGARILIGGRRWENGEAAFYEPTVLIDVDHSMEVMREETFGPVLPVMQVENEAEAIRLANDTRYGLSASVWTRDKDRGYRVAQQLRTGSVQINDHFISSLAPEVPYGGIKDSGFGRVGGDQGLLSMVHTKYIARDRLGMRSEPWWFPYQSVVYDALALAVVALFAKRWGRRLRAAIGLLRELPALWRAVKR